MFAFQSNFKEKLVETLKAVVPILLIVLFLCFSIAPIPPSILMTFLIGATLLVVGMLFFNVGVELSMTPIGEKVGLEKEIILIVTKTEMKNPIMQAIMQKAGPDSKAKAVTFSLPVSATAGLRLVEE